MQLTNSDLKLLDLIHFNLKKYKSGDIELSYLLDNLETLFKNLSIIDKYWNETFFQNLLNLESIYANSINKEFSINDEEKIIINESLEKIKLLVENALNTFIKTPNSKLIETAKIIDDEWLFCPICMNVWQYVIDSFLVVCPYCKNALLNPRFKNISQ